MLERERERECETKTDNRIKRIDKIRREKVERRKKR